MTRLADADCSDAELAVRVARAAGDLALRMRPGVGVETKSGPADVVSAADRAAERLVLARLAAARPGDGVVGEEGAARVGTSGRTWVVDPVDGTYNFVRGLDWWCSALALVEDGEPVVGAVHQPATGTTWVGGPQVPSTCDGLALPTGRDVEAAQACATSYLHPGFRGGALGAAQERATAAGAAMRVMGSGTLDSMAIADGRMDVLVQYRVPDWDRFPGAAVIRGVGGHSRVVHAAGVDWHVAGCPTPVAAVCAALLDE